MLPGVETPIQENSPSLVEDLKSVLENTQLEEGYYPDRNRQLQILNNLPENTVEQLHAHLHEVERESDFFAKIRGEEKSETDDAQYLRGEVFELLVENDRHFGERTVLGDYLLDILHNPRRFSTYKQDPDSGVYFENYSLYEKIGQNRNPDLAFTKFDPKANRYILMSAGEAKLGLLSPKVLKQLRDSGIGRGIRKGVAALNNEDDVSLNSVGLEEVTRMRAEAKNKNPNARFITIDKKFKQVLIIPANRDSENPESLINTKSFSYKDEIEELKEILENEVEIENAAFSVTEVAAISQYFLEKINERREKEEITTLLPTLSN
jgi:hypothetical protein